MNGAPSKRVRGMLEGASWTAGLDHQASQYTHLSLASMTLTLATLPTVLRNSSRPSPLVQSRLLSTCTGVGDDEDNAVGDDDDDI